VSLNELLATLKTKDIQLAITDGQLRVNGNKQALSEPSLLAALREHKPALIELIEAGGYSPAREGQVAVPVNGISPGTTRLTPAMLTMVDLSQDTLDQIVADPWRRRQCPGHLSADAVAGGHPLPPRERCTG